MADPRPSRRRYEIALWIDKRLGPLFCALALGLKRTLGTRRVAPPSAGVERILLLKMWGMGSIVLATPLLTRLRERYPGARIDFLTLRDNQAILAFYPQIDRVITLDLSRGVVSFLGQTLGLVWRLRRTRYDLLFDLEFFTRFSALLSFLVAPAWSHGFSAKGSQRGQLHDVEVPFNAYAHVTTNFLTLLSGDYMLPVDDSLARSTALLPRLVASAEAWQRCQEKLRASPGWREGAALVVVNPNAGDMAIERRWPVARFGELLNRLSSRAEINLVLIGSPAERPHVAQVLIASGCAERLIDLSGRTSIEELVALLERADLLVSNDSGPVHIAAAAGAATVALFGPETPVLYAPLRSREGQQHRIHYLGLGCSPCMFVHDNKVLSCWFSNARCMDGIVAEDVAASVDALLAQRRAVSAG